MTDINLGIYTANLDPARCIYATSESLRISHHHFHDVLLSDFLEGLSRAEFNVPPQKLSFHPGQRDGAFEVRDDEQITIMRMIERLNGALDDSMVVIADIGDALFSASELVIHRQTEFLGPAYYATMGFAVPAALGASFARPQLRPVVLVGDGAMQMTGMELSTIVRWKLNPIVIVLNNEGYGTERLLHPGDHIFNEINSWQYHKLPELLGGGVGYEVRTEGEFDRALNSALENTESMSLIHVHLPRDDCSTSLDRLARKLRSKV